MKIVPKARLGGGAVVDLDEVRAVNVAELGRHETVHEPADEDDLGRVPQLIGLPALLEQDGPAPATQRKTQVVDDEGGQQKPRVGSSDALDEQLEVDVADRCRDQDEDDDRYGDRDDRAWITQRAESGGGGSPWSSLTSG